MANKRLLSAIGALFLVLGAIFPLLGLSYVLYWGPMPETLPITSASFPMWSFWLGIVFLIIGLVAFAFSGYGIKE